MVAAPPRAEFSDAAAELAASDEVGSSAGDER
jgi:hypothetical protein